MRIVRRTPNIFQSTHIRLRCEGYMWCSVSCDYNDEMPYTHERGAARSGKQTSRRKQFRFDFGALNQLLYCTHTYSTPHMLMTRHKMEFERNGRMKNLSNQIPVLFFFLYVRTLMRIDCVNKIGSREIRRFRFFTPPISSPLVV